jgi:peroxiredoxin
MAVESSVNVIERLPEVSLPDLDGRLVHLSELAAGRPLVVAFACNHCPYVKWVENGLSAVAERRYDAVWVAISSNDVDAYPDDDVPGLRDQAQRAGWSFPYLVDVTQDVARTFGAVCTPDFFVFDGSGTLVYRGAMDDARPNMEPPVDGKYLDAALDAIAAGRPLAGVGRPSLGCSIKWRDA